MEDYNTVSGCYLSDATGGRPYSPTDPSTVYHSTHNPFVYYPDINGNLTRCLNIVNANGLNTGYFAGPNGALPSALLSDLNGQTPPNLMWLSPNACNDGHDFGTAECPVSDPVLEQNNYLQSLVPMILNSNTFKNKPSALYITWDEGNICSSPGQTFPKCTDPVATIWAGPSVRQGYQSSITYSHYSFMATLEKLWNLSPLPTSASVNARPMLEFFARGDAIAVIRGMNNVLYWSSFGFGSWSTWSSLGVSSPSRPALCAVGSGRVDLIVRGVNNIVYHTSFLGRGWSGVWDVPYGLTADQPACAATASQLLVVIRGLNNATYYNSLSLSTGVWSGWSFLDGWTPSAPSLAVDSSGTIHLIVRGLDNGIYTKYYVNGSWSSSWNSPGGGTSDTPAAIAQGDLLYVVIRGLNNATYYNSLSLSTGVWSGWSFLDGWTPSAPSLAVDSSGTIHLIVRGLDNGIYHKAKPQGSGWNGNWDTPSGATQDSPSITQFGSGLVVLITGTNNAIYATTLSGSSWSTWTFTDGWGPTAPVISIML
jgi:hypothetical protein